MARCLGIIIALLTISSGVAHAADKSATRPNVISVPSGPGSVVGLGESFEVNLNSGSVKETIPIKLPPGTAGMAPSLALHYDSGAGNGPVGIGWSLPIASIQVQTDKGLPKYDGTDRYLYEGSEIVPVGNSLTYRLKNEGAFVRVRHAGSGWQVDLPSGGFRRFGYDASSRIEDSGRSFAWLLEEESDPFGNRVIYSYGGDRGQVYLTSILYNRRDGAANNQVTFEYEDRPDALTDYRATFPVMTAKRLKAIRVFAQRTLLRRYSLIYDPTAPLSLLATVRQFGTDDSSELPPLELSYTSFNPSASPIHSMPKAPALLPGSEGGSAELADMDGDGFPDVLIADGSRDGQRYYRNRLGQGFEGPISVAGASSVFLSTTGVELADMNGDGLADLVARTGVTSSAFRYFPNTGGKWAESVVFGGNPSFQPEDGQTRWADLDHDKLPDAFRLNGTAATWWHNNGDGTWSAAQSLDLPPGNTVLDFNDPRVQLADFNGDGVIDVAFVRSGSVMYWPGMGRGKFASPIPIPGAPTVGTGLESRLHIADLNGDGLADLFYVDTDHLDYWLLLPSGSYDARRTIANTPYANAALTQVRTADMNGNGSVDVVWFTPSAAPDQRVQYFDAQEGVRPNLLRVVKNGLGLVRTLVYTSSGKEFEASIENGAPWTTRLPFPVHVLGMSTLSDSRGGEYATTYQYRNGYYDAGNREFRGFGRVQRNELGEADDPTEVTLHDFDLGIQHEALKGREVAVETQTAGGEPLVRVERKYNPRLYAQGTDGRSVAGGDLQREETTHYEGGNPAALVREEWTFDDYGNRLTDSKWGLVVNGDPLAGNDESITTTTYVNDPDAWILGRPMEETVADATGKVLTRTRHYYDGPDFVGLPLGQMTRGVLTRDERWVEGDQWIQSSRLSRDAFGNVVATLSPRGARRDVTWDDTHTFPTYEALALESGLLLQFRAAYSPRGLLTSFTDSNDASTSFNYDALDRLTSIVKPGDSADKPTVSYEYRLSSPLSSFVRYERPTPGSGETVQGISYFDGLGRTIAQVVQAEGGKWAVSHRRAYSRRGGVLTEWDPYFANSQNLSAGDPQTPASRFGYDVLGRQLWTAFPDNTRAETHYGALWHEEWDAEDLTASSPHYQTPTRFESDGLGRTRRIIERLGSQSIVTQFAYDAAGRRFSVTPANGNATTYGYDGADRLRSVIHPDAGTRSFFYDDDGNVVRSVDALGQRIEWGYDFANRPLSESRWSADDSSKPDRIRYTYDISSQKLGGRTNAMGKLSWVEDLSGETHFAYDARGRIATKLVVANGKEYRLSETYDNRDQISSVTYPDGETLEYRYNERGLLESVPYVINRLEYDANGLPTRREYANGVVSHADYDVRKRVRALSATSKAGATIQDLGYVYDLAGTLTSIEDHVRADGKLSQARAYVYDDLYRLKTATSPAGGTSSFDYDPVGNLLQKTGAGAYVYGGIQPNAVQSIGGAAVTHDANGAVTGSWGRTFEYDPAGMLRKVTGANGSVAEYLYDYEGHRRLKTATGNGATKSVVYVDRLAEDRDGQLVKYVFAGDVRLARIGGGTPKVLAVASILARHLPGALGISALAMLALGAAFQCSSWGRRRRFGRRAFAGAVALSVGACSCQGGDSMPAPLKGTIFYTSNHLGSGELLTDSAGNVVGESSSDAWGLQVVATDEFYGFTGKEWDAEAGLFYFGARYYDPKAGQFLTVDPAALSRSVQHMSDPQSLNPFSYARNTPTCLRDADGREPAATGNALAPTGGWINTARDFVSNLAAFGAGFAVGMLQGKVPFGGMYNPTVGIHDPPYEMGRGVGLVAGGLATTGEGAGFALGGAGFGIGTSWTGVGAVGGAGAVLAGTAWAAGGVVNVKAGVKAFMSGAFAMKSSKAAGGAGVQRAPPANGGGAAKGEPPPNMSPDGAGRQGAFNEAKRNSGVPTSQSPDRVLPNVDKRGNPQPGRIYQFDVPKPGGGTRPVEIRDDAAGHNFGPDDPQNRGPHFNDGANNHYDY